VYLGVALVDEALLGTEGPHSGGIKGREGRREGARERGREEGKTRTLAWLSSIKRSWAPKARTVVTPVTVSAKWL